MAEPSMVVILNGASQTVQARQLSGFQIRALFDIDPALDLVVEGKGSSPDRMLLDKEIIKAEASAVRIYARPPTMFGWGRP